MRLNRNTLIALLAVEAALFGFAGWGHHLAMDPEILDWVKTGAMALGAAGLAFCGALISRGRS